MGFSTSAHAHNYRYNMRFSTSEHVTTWGFLRVRMLISLQHGFSNLYNTACLNKEIKPPFKKTPNKAHKSQSKSVRVLKMH